MVTNGSGHPSRGAHTTRLLRSADTYTGAGWKVFPCRPHDSYPGAGDAKRPLTKHGFKNATDDMEQVKQWWQQWPGALLAIALPPGVVVIDIDPRDGGSIEHLEALNGGTIPTTFRSQSGRGDGAHFWFTTRRGELKQRTIAPGIDSRIGGKGYMIVPPSLHPATGQPYRWTHVPQAMAPLPRALERLLTPRKAPAWFRPHSRLQSPLQANQALRGLIRTVEEAGEGERNARLFWAACRMVEREQHGQPVDWDALAHAAIDRGLTDREVMATIHSAKGR